MAKCKRSVLNIIMKRKLQYFGHITRKNSLQNYYLKEKWTPKGSEEEQGECGWTISMGGPTKDHTQNA